MCFVITECESSFKPESVAHRTGSKHAASTLQMQQNRMSHVASRDARFSTENGLQRSLRRRVSRRHSAADEDLYCPMNGVRADSGRRHPRTTNGGRADQNAPVNLHRALSDETLSLHSHSRRLQHAHRDAVRPNGTHTGRRTSALDVATNSATLGSRRRRDGHHRTFVNTSYDRTVVNNRPDLLCTWKDRHGENCISPVSCTADDCSGPRHSSPQDDDLGQRCGDTNETVSGTLPTVTQSPQSIVSDGSPGSQYPIAPAASPVTMNSMVFTPPPCTLVSSPTTATWPPATSLPLQPSKMDNRSNTDSGYGSKIYRCQGSRPAVEPVTSCQEPHAGPIKTDGNQQGRMCSSIPDVVVDQPAYHSGPVTLAATLPRTAFDHTVLSDRRLRHSDACSPPVNLGLMTYNETNLVVSPCRSQHRQSRVPMELADENSVVEIGETFSPMSPLSLDSIDLVENVSQCILSSPTNNVPITAVPLEANSHTDVPELTKFIGSAHSEASGSQLDYNVSSVSAPDSQCPGSRNLSIIREDARQTSGESESDSETDDCCRSPVFAEASFDDISGAVNSTQVKDDMMHRQLPCDAQPRCLQIGRCTTV